jgi:hypothetical protein
VALGALVLGGVGGPPDFSEDIDKPLDQAGRSPHVGLLFRLVPEQD